jgi:hypothetical protein
MLRHRRDEIELGAEAQLAVPACPVVVESIGLAFHARLEAEVRWRVEPHALEEIERARLRVGGQVLVEDEDRIEVAVLEEGVP